MSNSPRNQAPSELPSQNIFANLIGGPDLHVPDWPIYKHIRTHGKSIKGLAEYQLYVDFILEKSAGRINRAQWHSRATIMEVISYSDKHYERLEQQWLKDGWLCKEESKGRSPSMRALGRQFDHIRIKFYNSPQSGGCYKPNPPKNGGGNSPQNGGPNPNNLNPNLSLSSYEEREREQKAKEAPPFNEGAPQEEKKLRKVEQFPNFLSDAIGRKRSK